MKILTKPGSFLASSIGVFFIGITASTDLKAYDPCIIEKVTLEYCMEHNFRAPDWCYPEKQAHLECLAKISYIPHYSTYFWNTNSRRPKNNCYNYSANKATDNFAQPGYASGSPTFSDDPWSCDAVVAGAKGDSGITATSFLSSSNKKTTLMALVIAPGRDYHWYRRDSNKRWSHKPGQTSATNKDNSGRLISDPRNADRGIYTRFCGFFKTRNTSQSQNAGTANIKGWMNFGRSVDSEKESSAQETGSKITLLIYSGRPNPTMSWSEFNQLNSGILSSQITSFNPGVQPSVEIEKNTLDFIPSKLGYQGILIEDNDGVLGEKGAQILLYNGNIRTQTFSDAGGFKQLKMDVSVLEQSALETISQHFEIDVTGLTETAH